ncbi:MAG TPA: hypothetical protein VF479_05905 [Pseudolysinimonas sp.]
MIRRGLPGVVALSALLVLPLAGCGVPIPGDTGPETVAPSEPPVAETPTPIPDPSEVTDPGPGSGSDPLQPHDAYARCVTLVSTELYPGEAVTPAGYQDADVIARSDGLYYVYVEVTVDAETDPAMRDVAFECVLGGTFDTPNDARYGKRPRAPLSDRDPEQPLSD